MRDVALIVGLVRHPGQWSTAAMQGVHDLAAVLSPTTSSKAKLSKTSMGSGSVTYIVDLWLGNSSRD